MQISTNKIFLHKCSQFLAFINIHLIPWNKIIYIHTFVGRPRIWLSIMPSISPSHIICSVTNQQIKDSCELIFTWLAELADTRSGVQIIILPGLLKAPQATSSLLFNNISSIYTAKILYAICSILHFSHRG